MTTLIQLFKGKGSKENLESYRFIHTKDWFPKTFEALVVEKMKPKLMNKMSMFQIAKAGHRPQEHIFVAKSIIAYYKELQLPFIMQFFLYIKIF